MSSTCVIGLQWGDEAKGKIVDLLCEHHDVVVRFQGGSNAGHTVVVGGVKYKLSLIPTGILHPNVTCVLGNGVVIQPLSFLAELDGLRQRGISLDGRLLISDRAHVVFPYHVEEERLTEDLNPNPNPNPNHSATPSVPAMVTATATATATTAIGTTRRGIGPCYRDKVGRAYGIRLGELARPEAFRTRLNAVVAAKNQMLSALLPEFTPLDANAMADEYLAAFARLQPYLADTATWLHEAVRDNRRLMFEGAQGSLLDVDHGSYPFVTGSNSSAAGLWSGSGLSPRHVDRWIGIAKAYTTRVGRGPFPTEQENATGERIRQIGHEYGTVTGRPRRCGWFDAVATRYSARLCGVTECAVMLLDVLSGLETLQVAIAYETPDGQLLETPPADVELWGRCRPVYTTLPGWADDLTGLRQWDDLPANAQGYVRFVAQQLGVPVRIVSVGPDRAQTIPVPENAVNGR